MNSTNTKIHNTIDPQAEINELFSRVDKNLIRSQKNLIKDEDLNRVRAFVV